MNKPEVYVTRALPPPGIEILKECCNVEVNRSEDAPPKEEIIKKVAGKDGLLCLLTDKIDREVMEAAPKLVVISSYSVGYDHIDVAEATKRGIYVTYTPGVLTDATADFAWALMMSIARRVTEADRYVRGGKWKIAWAPTMLLGAAVYGKTLGILGIGRIGSAVAKRAMGFNMKVLYYDEVRPPKEMEEELNLQYRPLDEVLKESDFVSIHVPLTEKTRHLINYERLKLMKPTAFLINTARGAVVDTKGLARALEEGVIAGAALDVHEREPIEPNNPLLKLEDKCILAPHIASGTVEARSKMAEIAATNLIAVLKGEMPPNLVNPDAQKVRPLSKAKRIP
ncbi:MAG: D-glycerate dehydrogenase [Candidatus Brockarchaeota archaeon]|nr:D-glycerate dehydrogenase [Candidatus Brockarchaeota archaeon]